MITGEGRGDSVDAHTSSGNGCHRLGKLSVGRIQHSVDLDEMRLRTTQSVSHWMIMRGSHLPPLLETLRRGRVSRYTQYKINRQTDRQTDIDPSDLHSTGPLIKDIITRII